MRKSLIILLTSLLVVACMPERSQSDSRSSNLISSVTHTPSIERIDSESVTFSVDNISIGLIRPQDWELYATDYGIVLTEFIGSIAVDGNLGGLLTHVFVPPLDDVTLTANNDNPAQTILHEITQRPEYINNASTTQARSFQWQNLDAAYFLMNNGQGTVTLVLGLYVPEGDYLVTCQVSAPLDQADRIREALPTLLDQLSINSITLDGEALDAALPARFEFPAHPS